MATLADPTWVEYWLELGDVHVFDPRPSLAYNRGHLPGAVNVPLERLIDERGALLPDEALGAVFGAKQAWTNRSAPLSTTVPMVDAAR